MSSAAAEQSTSGAPAPLASMASLASASERLRPAAVEVRGAYKNYGDTVVLAGIDMTVPRGTIYGLLGASGCGKTTLLSCIAGRRHLDAGSARVFGEEPAPGPRLGFMPQELALYMEFSIAETLFYFGTLVGMRPGAIEERTDRLLELLHLPCADTRVAKLSGGQQRRVSFAAALLHDPELLVLDEPTVGVDPVLRHSIWDYLVEITKTGDKSVIITTHYIEESKQAHTVGLMRGGRLLAEDAPDRLTARFSCGSLERVFLLLSSRQLASAPPPPSEEQHARALAPPLPSPADCPDAPAQTLEKDSVMLFIFAQPVLQIMFFCLAIGQDPTGLSIAVVNHELNSSYLCSEHIHHQCQLEYLSCRYLHHLNNSKSIVQENYSNISNAVSAVKSGHVWGAIYFTENYTESLLQRINFSDTSYFEPNDWDNSEIKVWMDQSNQHIAQTIQYDLVLTYQAFLADVHMDCKWNLKLAEAPIKFETPVYGSIRPVFTDFACPGTILMIIYFLAVTLTAGVILTEKTEGLLDRALMTGLLVPEILVSHVVTQFAVICGQTSLVLLFSFAVFNIPHHGPMFAVIVLTLLQGLSGMCFGLLISSACDNIMMATYLGMGSFHPLVILSGVIWPIEGMHSILRYISYCLPLTYPTESLRCLLLRGWGVDSPTVYGGFLVSVAWITIYVITTLVILRFKKL
ncbi:Protein white [Gryllus bimaculatus]|nr:Protein white [Gryllus bimaculatus]